MTTPAERARAMSSAEWLAAAGAVLTGLALLLLAVTRRVPSDPAEMISWVGAASSLLSWSDELLFFAVVAGTAGAFALTARRFTAHPRVSTRIAFGLAALAVAMIALLVVLLAVGRLVYPVFGIASSADTVAALVSATFGALHLALLGFAVAAATLTWSRRVGRRILSVALAAVFAVGSFPWLTPGWFGGFVAVVLAAWGVLLAMEFGRTAEQRVGS